MSSSSTMRAIVMTKTGSPQDALQFKDIPKPTPGCGDILVRIHAISVNPIDYKIRAGYVPIGEIKEPGHVLGYDAAGVVVEVGKDVTKFKVGDEVWYAGTLSRAGSYAQYQTMDARLVSHKPKTLSFEQAAAVPLVALTAWELLVEHFNIDRPALRSYNTEKEQQRTLLVIAGAGGVGSFSIQIGKLFGLRVIATASRPETVEFAKSQGADLVIDHSKGIQAELKKHGIEEVDFVYNTAGTDLKELIPIVTAHGGIGNIAQPIAMDLETGRAAYMKALQIQFEIMFARSFTKHAQRSGDILAHVASLIDQGKLKSNINPKYTKSWENIVDAHHLIDSGKTVGKIVLTVEH